MITPDPKPSGGERRTFLAERSCGQVRHTAAAAREDQAHFAYPFPIPREANFRADRNSVSVNYLTALQSRCGQTSILLSMIISSTIDNSG